MKWLLFMLLPLSSFAGECPDLTGKYWAGLPEFKSYIVLEQKSCTEVHFEYWINDYKDKDWNIQVDGIARRVDKTSPEPSTQAFTYEGKKLVMNSVNFDTQNGKFSSVRTEFELNADQDLETSSYHYDEMGTPGLAGSVLWQRVK